MALRRQIVVVLACWLWVAGQVAAGPRPWISVRTPHFTILTDAGVGEGRALARKFEEFRAVFDRMTQGAIRNGERPITVVAVRNEAAMRDLLPGYWETQDGFRPAGVFIRGLDRHHIALRLDANDAYADAARELGLDPKPYRIVFHEYVHSLLQGNESLPLWLNEGLAEFYASSRIDRDRVLLGQPAPATIWYLRERTMLPIATLLEITRQSGRYRQEPGASQFYAQAWALVHYLRVGPGRDRGLLRAYREQLASGKGSLEAARAAFGDLDRLQAALSSYVEGRAFHQELLPGPTHVDDTTWTVEEVHPVTVTAVRARIHVDMGRYADARALLDAALAVAPDHAGAWDTLSWLEHREQRYEQALAACRRAIASGSISPMTYYVAGSLIVRRAVPSDAAAVEGRALVEKSIALDAAFAPALTALAELVLDASEPPVRVLELASRAMTAAPREPGGYQAAARALVRLDRVREARDVLQQGLRTVDSDEDRGRLRDTLNVVLNIRRPSVATAPPDIGQAAAPETRQPVAREKDSGVGEALKAVRQAGASAAIPSPCGEHAGTISLDTKGVDFTPWLRLFVYSVRRSWHVPPDFTASGCAVVRFTVSRDGTIRNVSVVHSSGHSTLDTAAARAVAVASPTLALPVAYPEPEVEVHLPFHYNPPAAPPN
jgi:TonB family protein